MSRVIVLVVDGKKPCSTCKEVLPASMFNKTTWTKSGYSSQCTTCKAAAHRQYRIDNPEKCKLSKIKWVQRNPEKMAAARLAWAIANPERQKQAIKNWEAKNKDAKSSQTRNYRARKRGAEGSHSKVDIDYLRASQKNLCPVCRDSLDNGYHVDHIVALVNGGSNGRKNIQLLCPDYNFRKSDKDPVEFMHERGFLL